MHEFFDCNCCFGVLPVRIFRFARNVEELREEMEFCHIGRALVYHATMHSFGSPIEGNDLLLQEIAGRSELFPTRAILPPQTGEQPEPAELLAEMKRRGIRALWAFPGDHHYLLNRETFGSLFDLLSERRVPVFVLADLVQIGELLRSCPDLTVVAASPGPVPLDRYFRPLIERYRNFHIETSCYMVARGIESFCEKYGPGRMLFGTGYPANTMGAAMLHLARADIDEAGKKAIAAGNLERLLKEVEL
jgi:predicted TIM-barrel fold metal-dependent hydrolase